jgi:hypothetical protein
MKTGAKIGIGLAVAVVLIGGELLYLHHERSKPMVGTEQVAQTKTDPDNLVFLKHKRPSSMGDLKELFGTTVWMSAGGQMDYYPSTGKHADYAHPAGTLLGAEPLEVKDAFEQVAPKQATYRIPGGDRQVLLSFTLPKSADPTKVYAVPVGYQKGPDFTFYTDEIFFYDDPHLLYKHWGPQIWQAVDSHQVILGMNEAQVQLALGQVSKSLSEDYGNRLVIFANLGHPMAVTFVKNKVTAFRPDQGF